MKNHGEAHTISWKCTPPCGAAFGVGDLALPILDVRASGLGVCFHELSIACLHSGLRAREETSPPIAERLVDLRHT